MSLATKLKRYLLIIEKVGSRPTFAQLHDHLSDHDMALSQRTLQRDIESLRAELGVEIEYDRPNNVYRMSATSEEHHTVMQLLERAQLLDLAGSDPAKVRELARHIDFEGLGQLQGLQHLAPLLRAVREGSEVDITYRRFRSDRSATHRVRPMLMKEYHGRWYVMGIGTKHAEPITLGLDRMEAVTITGTKFKRNALNASREMLATMIGVDASPEKAERVTIEATVEQAKYIASLPWHASQKVERESRSAVIISWHLRPNFELRQRILGLGADVRVLEPKSLAKEIREAHKAAAARYKK